MGRHFPTTRWSVVLGATGGPREGGKALHELCEAYWRPLYAFLRRDGMSREDAEDTVQGFVADLLARPAIEGIERERGRFRSYLLGALRHFVTKQRTRAHAAKRGGGQAAIPPGIDADEGEALQVPDDRTPEGAYAYAWAMEILGRARRRLAAEYEADGRHALYEALHPFLLGGETPAYRDVAVRLSMTEANARVAVHRLRTRFRAALRSEVVETVAADTDVDDEIRAVITALRT